MLDATMTQQLKTYLANLREPVELVASLGDDDKSTQTRELLEEIAALHDLVSASFDGSDARKPSFIIRRGSDAEKWVRFAGLPMGHEFTSLVLALLWAGGHPPKVDADLLEQVRGLEGDFNFEMYFSLSCHNCPDVVQALTLLALENSRVTATLIEGGTFQDEVEARDVMAVPATFLNGEPFYNGKLELAEILAKIDTASEAKAAEKLAAKDPFEVLVIGGGPAGAATAIYTARKGFRTGVAAERFGGQLHDTLGIENLPGTPYTEGPKLAGELKRHVGEYDIDLMDLAKAVKLVPAKQEGGLYTVEFGNGASLKARSLILATGARWRNLGVPGEAEYRNKGVAYCPHCDGPLFKGKRIAVIGGGNSGVEAAIDLAGVVGHVTLIEFDSKLRADEVLQAKLRSMANVEIITNGQTTEILGAEGKVNGLRLKDRESGDERTIELEGVFVQIGLVPNTEWLEESGLELTKHGEIATDEEGRTNLPGVFGAGDVTDVPYKQIVVAMGEGSKAGLSAFDYLIRTEPADEIAQAA
ncbi:alkyl hydroperoxide reductase subunit F [Qipengyuania flava]|uniref:alkyl hydroperoxide reductase subunit F n=1 Tax=Qipengyuania flava TaxID=192812 RepID=UPI001C570A25|nr:alkyl hydroperoxide reductase subunit F [Qipengyuania flava]MBW3167258.1 alkyl hydroperoxide reductase subunit F [Qipengyuania flava]MBY5964496.1 alkyl hydroperoxide reductase subunit F [Qipengyuania flava]MBY6010820.1 alkyl hydroperoxide reductase subunit F [Qipengyuania flava]MBY6025262.1 alkyl hydroperoxide reductase subunit F [Qipengyuania flava]